LLEKGQRRSFESVEFLGAKLPGYELGSRGIRVGRVGIEGDLEEMARRELYCAKKTSCVL
jgi:hypothetical protein